MKQSPIGRLFIVGSPRSGTTLLQCLLAAHTQIISLPETDYFVNLVSGRRSQRFLGLASQTHGVEYKRFLKIVGIADERLLRHKPLFAFQRANLFVNTLNELARKQGKTVWLEKSPYHARCIPSIEKYVPCAKFVHNVRSGPDNIASQYDVLLKYPDQWKDRNQGLEECIERWISDVRISLNCVHKPNHLIVGYHQVTRETCPTLQRICDFIGVPFEETMTANYSGMVQKVMMHKEKWKESVALPISDRNGTKFMELFTADQRRYILNRVAEVDLSPLGIF